ncbi:hypothetical protein VTO42DRAFT_4997 [Malbranchea cinnamomea]
MLGNKHFNLIPATRTSSTPCSLTAEIPLACKQLGSMTSLQTERCRQCSFINSLLTVSASEVITSLPSASCEDGKEVTASLLCLACLPPCLPGLLWSS